MADIYESLTQQVGITGPREAPGFKPAQAYDPSRQILEDRGVEEFAAFSETLAKAINEKAKEINKAEYMAGLTGLVEGETTLAPEVLQRSQEGQQELQAGVEAEIQTAEQIAREDPVSADVYYSRTPAVSGWRAYGQAVRQAQLAAAESEIFLEDFTTSTDEANAVVVTLPDGSTKRIIPAAVQTHEELAAVLSAASTALITKKGLDRLNPAILAEHVIPRLTEARTTIQGRRLRELQSNLKQASIDELDTHASRLVPSLTTPEEAAKFVPELFDSLFVNLRNRREANEEGSRIIFGTIESMIETQPARAREVLDILAATNISSTNPKLGTLGDRFESEISRLQGAISKKEETIELQFQEDLRAKYEGILGQYELIQQTGTLQEVQRAFDETEQALIDSSRESTEDGIAAGAALGKLRLNSRNYSVVNERAIIENVDDPYILQSFLQQGYIKQEAYESKLQVIETPDELDRLSSLRSQLTPFITQLFADKIGIEAGVDPQAKRNLVAPFATVLVDELISYAVGLNRAEIAKSGRGLSNTYLYDKLIEEGQRKLQTNPRFQIRTEGTGTGLRIISNLFDARFMPSTVRLPNGQTVDDLVSRGLQQLPTVIPSSRSRTLSPDLIESSIRAIENGGPIDPRVRIVAAAANVNPMELLRVEASRIPGFDPNRLNVSQAQQRFNENSRRDPTAARILANPRSTPLQRRRATDALERARQRESLAASLSAEGAGDLGGAFGGPAFASLRDEIFRREGGAAGYNAANRGGPGDTPGGVPGLANMTLRQVLQLYDTGGYNVLGGFQFKKATLQNLIRASGVSLDEKFSAQTQNRLFETYFTVGANYRRKLSDYVNGRTNDLRGALEDLSLEFAVVRSLTGRGQYAGQPATLDAAVLLRQMRETNIRNRGAGEAGGGSGQRVDMSSRNIQSITIENPRNPGTTSSFQPGFDLWFKDKRFGAVLGGVVKEIRLNNGRAGNTLIVESIDPATGEKVDVVYSHFDRIAVRVGDRINPGQYLGKQGSTGNVRSADGTIASVDFYRPAPVGSNDNTPYRNWQQLVRRLKAQIESGGRF